MAQATPSSRDDIRAAMLGAKPKSAIVEVFGQKVEIRQAKVGEVLGGQEADEKIDRATAFAHLLVRFCYVPGTKDRVFDETDIEALKSLPLGEELSKLQAAVNDLMGLNVQGELKNSKGTSSAST